MIRNQNWQGVGVRKRKRRISLFILIEIWRTRLERIGCCIFFRNWGGGGWCIPRARNAIPSLLDLFLIRLA